MLNPIQCKGIRSTILVETYYRRRTTHCTKRSGSTLPVTLKMSSGEKGRIPWLSAKIETKMDSIEPRYQQQLFFDPDKHPENTLKAFNEFTQAFELRYEAQFPDPSKVSMDAAIQRWKFAHTANENSDPKPNLAQYDEVREDGDLEIG